MSAISELIERVEKATGADREIDELVRELLCGDEIIQYGRGDHYMPLRQAIEHARKYNCMSWVHTAAGVTPAYTGSLDAAMALVEAKLPGWEWGIRNHDYEQGSLAYVYKAGKIGESKHYNARLPTPALALLAALLKALSEADVVRRVPG